MLKNTLLIGLALLAGSAAADPCGMVPPIHITNTSDVIQRVGAQRTYVSFRDGIETIALRPGFEGKLDAFGMLIPFPSPPAIRKLDDSTFAHIEAAIDPPVVNVHITDPRRSFQVLGRRSGIEPPTAASAMESGLRYSEVRVLREEAVGMYQVAVLEAGSAAALSRWMSDSGYQYPDGMDDVANDYVREGWCFVAVKAKVGQAPGVAPEPGMRAVDPNLPDGATFDGYVQGMAFRFETAAPVVPMRLSVFNGPDPRNVVYMLTDQPVKIAGMPDALVVRQLSGAVLHGHLTAPLDVVYHNGDEGDVSESDRQRIADMRSADPFLHVARDLFAADLLAARTGRLSLPFEELEKELLAVSESFGLRGEGLDALHAEALVEAKALAVQGALGDVREMHLSVIDGVLDGQHLAAQNLEFSAYEMPTQQNRPRRDAIRPADLTTWVEQR
ncbi:MAG: DUF2330 domain-containing protein [Myxococcota bacterium]|nr:DUF2330 domain-containing protein [Myxococcota bacterium]